MNLLLHSCCADCTLKFIQALDLTKIELTVYFYNPNIHPRSEYLSRLRAIQKVCRAEGVKLIVANWSPKEYFQKLSSNQKPTRCQDCWKVRLSTTATFASSHGFSHFSSTLLSSQYQSKDFIITLGNKIAKQNNLEFFTPEKIDPKLKTSGFYKQNYCGCCFSLVERLTEKFSDLSNLPIQTNV